MVYSWKLFERSSCSTGVKTSHTSILQSQSCQSCQYCWSHIQWPQGVCSQSAGSNALMALTNQTKLDYYNQDLLSWITQLILDLSRHLERVRLELLKHLTWWNSIKISSRKGCFILHCYLSSTAEVYNPSINTFSFHSDVFLLIEQNVCTICFTHMIKVTLQSLCCYGSSCFNNFIFPFFSPSSLLHLFAPFPLSPVLIKQAELVDESSVKKMILTFEKRSYKNQELRIKFPDNPEK